MDEDVLFLDSENSIRHKQLQCFGLPFEFPVEVEEIQNTLRASRSGSSLFSHSRFCSYHFSNASTRSCDCSNNSAAASPFTRGVLRLGYSSGSTPNCSQPDLSHFSMAIDGLGQWDSAGRGAFRINPESPSPRWTERKRATAS